MKSKNLKKIMKNSSRVVSDSTERPKIRCLSVKDTAKN